MLCCVSGWGAVVCLDVQWFSQMRVRAVCYHLCVCVCVCTRVCVCEGELASKGRFPSPRTMPNASSLPHFWATETSLFSMAERGCFTLQAPGKFSALNPVNKTVSGHFPCAQPLAVCLRMSDWGQPEWVWGSDGEPYRDPGQPEGCGWASLRTALLENFGEKRLGEEALGKQRLIQI